MRMRRRAPVDGVNGRERLPARAWRLILRVPLFLKVLIANAVLVGAAATAGLAAGTALEAGGGVAGAGAWVWLVGLAVAVGSVVNAGILWVALSPVRQLEEAARRVGPSERGVRVHVSAVADRGLMGVARAFNELLDGMEVHRARSAEVAARALRTAEDERRRMARELHDGTAQALTSALLRLRVARSLTDETDRDAAFEVVRRELADAVEHLRHFARTLRPPALEELGLRSAVDSLGREIAANTDLDIRIRAEGVDGEISEEAALALFRIAQEALSNVVKHAGARRVEVALRPIRGAVELIVSDDGIGFNVGPALAGRGSLGLFGMRERASYLGGEVEIRSEPGTGTMVRARIPASARPQPRPARPQDGPAASPVISA